MREFANGSRVWSTHSGSLKLVIVRGYEADERGSKYLVEQHEKGSKYLVEQHEGVKTWVPVDKVHPYCASWVGRPANSKTKEIRVGLGWSTTYELEGETHVNVPADATKAEIAEAVRHDDRWVSIAVIRSRRVECRHLLYCEVQDNDK